MCRRNSSRYGVKNGQLGAVEAIAGAGANAVFHMRLDDGARLHAAMTALACAAPGQSQKDTTQDYRPHQGPGWE